ncbi:hypothetical protein N7472_009124 [Penicillium cf. griseofulvum]|uniref:Uncharacterized protein n=1 Tax=Penicillium cf. griseofulvum TaxID=2972120 RepID=A0A9W9M0N9_9EURO|nr:hypothetical protein N7472_009124 [Penicillium cf. griseofulvum]
MASAASAGPPGGPPPPPGSLIRTPSDPSQVTPTASTLFSLREVWSWPSYEFLVKIKKDRTPVISADQIRSARPSYVNGLLIASRGVYAIGLAKATHLVNLSYDCLVPRRDAVPICNVRNSNEPRYIPQASAPLPPPSRVKELTDSDEANDDNGASGDGGSAGTSGTATAV